MSINSLMRELRHQDVSPQDGRRDGRRHITPEVPVLSVKSRFSAGVALLTAAALAVSSVTVAAPLPPALSVDAAKSPSTHRIADRRDRGERGDRSRVEWQRHYYDRSGRDRSRERRTERPTRAPARAQRRPAPRLGGRFVQPHRTVVVRPVPRGPRVVVPRNRRHYYRNVWVTRPYGHWYSGYGYHYHDHDAFPWLAFTAITLSLVALLTVAQQRAQEQAQIEATTAPVGSTIAWDDAGAAGSVSVLREGRSSSGKTCREFQQTVTVGGRSEQAYGTACLQPDGAWQIVKTQ